MSDDLCNNRWRWSDLTFRSLNSCLSILSLSLSLPPQRARHEVEAAFAYLRRDDVSVALPALPLGPKGKVALRAVAAWLRSTDWPPTDSALLTGKTS